MICEYDKDCIIKHIEYIAQIKEAAEKTSLIKIKESHFNLCKMIGGQHSVNAPPAHSNNFHVQMILTDCREKGRSVSAAFQFSCVHYFKITIDLMSHFFMNCDGFS